MFANKRQKGGSSTWGGGWCGVTRQSRGRENNDVRTMLFNKHQGKDTESERSRGKGGQAWRVEKSGVDVIEL